jgi:hypothetical protein
MNKIGSSDVFEDEWFILWDIVGQHPDSSPEFIMGAKKMKEILYK